MGRDFTADVHALPVESGWSLQVTSDPLLQVEHFHLTHVDGRRAVKVLSDMDLHDDPDGCQDTLMAWIWETAQPPHAHTVVPAAVIARLDRLVQAQRAAQPTRRIDLEDE